MTVLQMLTNMVFLIGYGATIYALSHFDMNDQYDVKDSILVRVYLDDV